VRIGIEGKTLTTHASGIGRYAINLTRTLLTILASNRNDIDFVIFTAPQTCRDILHGFPGTYSECGMAVKSSLLRSLAFLPRAIQRQRIDVFHGLDHVAIPLFGKQGKYVVTIHDIIPLLFPQFFPLKHRLVVRAALVRVAKQADMVIVPSQAVQEDVMQHLHITTDRLAVIPEGCERRFSPLTEPARLAQMRQAYGLPSQYLLFLGTLEPRKNVTTLLQAFAHLRQAQEIDPALRVVIAGAPGWQTATLYHTVRRLRLENAVVFPGFIAEADLPDLYRGAQIFVFPSLYEGFGLPVVEAMGCGVPVIASNTSALPEVTGGAALLVDPLDVAGLAAAIRELGHNDGLRQRLRCQGLARTQHFSWETAAQKTLELYRSLV
jgi:glycosyltransferase involved in cell wall biosynthesis